MEKKVLTRRELRQQKRRFTNNYQYLKKGSAVVGTALVTCSVAAPLFGVNQVEAVSNDNTVSASNVDKAAFINEIAKVVEPLADKNDLFASVMMAQAIVESNWGQNSFAQAPYNNLFGFEGQYQGQSAMLDKEDFSNGASVTSKKELKIYNSYKEAAQDYVEIMKTTEKDGQDLYFANSWKSNAGDYQTAAKALEGRFNQQPDYAQALINTIEENELIKYDQTAVAATPAVQQTPAPVAAAAPVAQAPEQVTQYVVQSGDTVASITENFGITPQQFSEWNGLQDNVIYSGQTVIVGTGAEAVTPTPAPAPVVYTVAPAEPEAAPVVEDTATPEAPVVVDTPAVPETPAQPDPAPVVDNTVTPDVVKPAPEENKEADTPAADPIETPAADDTADKAPAPTTPEVVQPETPAETPQPETPAPAPTETTPAPEQPATDQGQTNATGEAIVQEAEKYLGTPYEWGGRTPDGFDCSGFTQYVYKQVTGEDIGAWTVPQESAGTQISVDQARQGDLLFWGDQGATYHVAISTGGDGYIHASQPGEDVKYGSTQYYTPDFGVQVY
ncbi:C40 family peptidase [Enterococcus sp. 669A]|uniref:Peptidoglycan hydrolase n=1 Tax=Candidatus Enterococcus moelleringii TaxID=2815325 RepID=A0ABS3L4I1_9ENTE|nr:NlpC/P60 family protein [Enterococcus sp. 669A]MBO1304536.1 C40 family peptidase [Enterococcus sp. 669A]